MALPPKRKKVSKARYNVESFVPLLPTARSGLQWFLVILKCLYCYFYDSSHTHPLNHHLCTNTYEILVIVIRSFDFLTSNFGCTLPVLGGSVSITLANPIDACETLIADTTGTSRGS